MTDPAFLVASLYPALTTCSNLHGLGGGEGTEEVCQHDAVEDGAAAAQGAQGLVFVAVALPLVLQLLVSGSMVHVCNCSCFIGSSIRAPLLLHGRIGWLCASQHADTGAGMVTGPRYLCVISW